MKFEMLSHYGSEHYCPITTVKVLGSTMMEEYEFTESQRGGQGSNQPRNEDSSSGQEKKIIDEVDAGENMSP